MRPYLYVLVDDDASRIVIDHCTALARVSVDRANGRIMSRVLMFPIRCYTCNAVVAHHHREYSARRRNQEDGGNILNALGVHRMCCRRMFISFVDSLASQQLAYPNENVVLDKGGTTMLRRCEHENVVSCD
jgi:DNA-directed RNA polymerase subunit N